MSPYWRREVRWSNLLHFYNYTCCCLGTGGQPLLFNNIWSTTTLIFFCCIISCFCWSAAMLLFWCGFVPLLTGFFLSWCWCCGWWPEVECVVVTTTPDVGVPITVNEGVVLLLLLDVDIVASLRSGFGLFFVGKVCSRHPVPAASSSRSLVFRHFIRRFWNHIFTCTKRNHN